MSVIRTYKEQHPEVDWDHHVVYSRMLEDRNIEAIGHRPKDEHDYALDNSCWCCGQLRHEGPCNQRVKEPISKLDEKGDD